MRGHVLSKDALPGSYIPIMDLPLGVAIVIILPNFKGMVKFKKAGNLLTLIPNAHSKCFNKNPNSK